MLSNHFDSSVLKILADCAKSQQEISQSTNKVKSEVVWGTDTLGTSEIRRRWTHKTQWNIFCVSSVVIVKYDC